MPPLQFFGIMLFRIHEVHGTAEYIEHASIDALTAQCAEFLVQPFRIFPLQATWAVDTDIPQILCDALPDSRDTFEAS